MKRYLPVIAILGILTACEHMPDLSSIKTQPAMPRSPASTYTSGSDSHVLNIDDHQIFVTRTGRNEWKAGGGENDKDGFVQYRQKRAIEVWSKCRVAKVLSKKNESPVRATVNQCRA